jgi:hypothetical protein
MILAVIFSFSLGCVARYRFRRLRLPPGSVFVERTRPELAHSFGHLFDGLGELRPHGGGHVEHLQALWLDADLFEELLGVLDPFSSFYISFQEMALAFQSPGDERGVDPLLECLEDVKAVDFTGAHEAYDPHEGRVLQPHRAGQIGRVVRAKLAAEGNYLRLEIKLSQLSRSPSLRRVAADMGYFVSLS